MNKVLIAAGTQQIILTSVNEPEVEYMIDADAHVKIISVISTDVTSVRHAHVSERASVEWYTIILGGKVSQEIATFHDGVAARSQHSGLFFGMNHDHIAMNYWSEHQAPNTVGHILIHGVLFEQAYADFKGNVRITPTGHQTDASLTEHTILLGKRARSDSVPQLEIATNDVKVTHSSAMTRVDEEQLFYLASRGIARDEAQRLIVRGFLNDIIDQLPDESLQQSVRADIEVKLGYVAQ